MDRSKPMITGKVRGKMGKTKKSRPALNHVSSSSSTAPVAMATVRKAGTRKVTPGSNGTIVVSNCEYFTDFYAASTFASTLQAINPGLVGMFPWLSTIASCYEEYRFKKLVFKFRTGVSTSTPGRLYMACDLDAQDPAPATKAAMLANANYVDGPAWQNFEFDVKVGLNQFSGYKYVRTFDSSSYDLKTFDVGNLILASSAFSTGMTAGDILVDYVVELRIPQAGNLATSTAFTFTTIPSTPAQPFSGLPSKVIGLAAKAATNNIDLPAVGSYIINVISQMTPTDTEGGAGYILGGPGGGLTADGKAKIRDVFAANAEWDIDGPASAKTSSYNAIVDVLAPGARLSFTPIITAVSALIRSQVNVSRFPSSTLWD